MTLFKTHSSIDLSQLDKEIRPFPATAAQVVSMCSNSESKLSEITQLVECEPAIAIKILSVANSPLYAATRQITSINHAMVVLGYRTVTQLALSVASGPLFTAGDPKLMKHRAQLFNESLGVATVSRIFAETFELVDPSEAFLGGMMLDVGKLYFFDVSPTTYLEILQQGNHQRVVELENEVLGVTHPLVGAQCGRQWGLPAPINCAIKDHHLKLCEVDDQLTKTVLAGDYYARKWEVGFLADQFISCDLIEKRFAGQINEELIQLAQSQFSAFQSMFTS